MALTAKAFPIFNSNAWKKLMNYGAAGDTLQVALVASGTFTYGLNAQTTLTTFLAGDGTHGALTEVAGGLGYTRQNLTSVSVSADTNAGLSTLTCANPSWTVTTGFNVVYAVFYDTTVSNDLLCYWDAGGSQSILPGTFGLTISASGLVTAQC